MSDRDYVYKYVPVDKQDTGAYDEGYYYEYCHTCQRRTEHDDEVCCECSVNDFNNYNNR